MDRTTGTPLGAVLLVLLALGFGWALLGRHDGLALSGFGTSTTDSDFAAAQAQPALVWPQDMPEPMTNYVGRRVQAFGLQVMTWTPTRASGCRRTAARPGSRSSTPTESPYTVLPGQIVSLSGSVYPHDAQWPSQIFFCPDRQASASRLAGVPRTSRSRWRA